MEGTRLVVQTGEKFMQQLLNRYLARPITLLVPSQENKTQRTKIRAVPQVILETSTKLMLYNN
jgi:hypothetical protein